MRKFLLWCGTVWVGMFTVFLVVTILISGSAGSGGGGAVLGGVFGWLFALVVGLALSAPAFLNPPDDNGGLWAFRLPLAVWMFLMMIKLMSWMGFYILLGIWMLIFKVWHNHQNNQLPAFSNGAQPQFAGPQPYASQPPAGASPFVPAPSAPVASWQADPTGRYQHRWWDGFRWTDRVANGSFQAVDPM